MKKGYILITLSFTVFSILLASAQAQSSSCYINVSSQAPKCIGGTITSEAWDGCRNFVCSNGSNSVKIKACDKPSINPTYFEMYRTLLSGNRLGFCLDNSCFSNSDFFRSPYYVVCSEQNARDGNISVIEQHTFEHNVVMNCNLPGLNTTNFKWYVNGNLTFDKSFYDRGSFPNYRHTFPSSGTYDVKCVGTDDMNRSKSASKTINVTTRATPEEIAENPTVVRVAGKYVDDYVINVSCTVIGADASFFITTGGYSDENGSLYIDLRGDVSVDRTGNFQYIKSMPSKGSFEVTCRGAISDIYSTPIWQNYGGWIGFGCFGGARGGDPICEMNHKSITINLPFDPDVKSGYIEVIPHANDSTKYTAVPRATYGSHWRCQGPGFDSYAQPFEFTTSEENASISCYSDDGSTTSSWNQDVWLSARVNLTALRAAENQINTTSTQQCYSKVNDIPASCTGTITQDAKSGCRTIACSQGTNNIKILACDKPDSGTKQYFEMYRQSFAGTPPKVCIGNACIQNDGYKKSNNYPICANQTQGTNQTNGSVSTANIVFSPISTDASMIATCNAFNPNLNQNATSWRWDFGDGIVTERNGFRNITEDEYDYGGVYFNNDILHIFTSSGPQAVKCTATFTDGSTATATKTFNSRIQNEVIAHFREDNSTFSLWADPINAHTDDISTATNLWGYPFMDNDGEISRGSISSRAVPPNNTYPKPDAPGTWEMEWETQSTQGVRVELAYGLVGEYTLSFFGYLPNNITGYKTFGTAQVPIYQGVEYFPFNVPYGYLEIGGIESAAMYRFNIIIPNQSTQQQNQTQCYSAVKNIPATCTSTIASDTASGTCRTIQCGSGSNTIRALACDKPDMGTKTNFEIYRQSFSGSPPKVCIGTTCIQNEGYKKSPNYPICN